MLQIYTDIFEQLLLYSVHLEVLYHQVSNKTANDSGVYFYHLC